jgi:hypothetical protein
MSLLIGGGLLALWIAALAYGYWWALFAKRPPWN